VKLISLIVGLALFASCAPTASVSVFDRDYIGPRDTIAVVVDDASPNMLERQAWAQVNTAFASHRFVRSRFVMVERQRIDALLREYRLELSGLTNGTGSSAIEQVLGARYLAVAHLERASAVPSSVSVPFLNWGKFFTPSVASKQYEVTVELSLILIDTASGTVRASSRATVSKVVSGAISIAGISAEFGEGYEHIPSLLPQVANDALNLLLRNFRTS
jgi:Curli production assembly/transport component CsgG